MLDKKKIGYEFVPFTVDVDKWRLRFIADVIGEKNTIYTDESSAMKAGYKSLVSSPTFPFMLDMDCIEKLPVLSVLGMDIARLLHGSQEFEYILPICAGDQITVNSRIIDIYSKKSGALEFVVVENTYINQEGSVAVKAINTLIYRNE